MKEELTNTGDKDLLELASELRWEVGDDFHDKLTEGIYADAASITGHVEKRQNDNRTYAFDQKLDRILTSKQFGFPIMILILSVVLWLTIEGANVPSSMLSFLFLETIYPFLKNLSGSIGTPWWLEGFVIDGVYLAVAWVVSVMLPPMAIFFPLFTLLEDFGYLPRVAFNLDAVFKRSGAHGKQALTMSMGWGCNAAGVVATRIIDSPRERLIAIITNNFSLCNGRWPTQILIATIFIGALVPQAFSGVVSTVSVIGIAMLGVYFTFFGSWLLSRTLLKGEVSTFTLELPPYRPPRFWKTIYTSLIDRTLIVLWRAIVFAAPAGAIIWLISNISVGNLSLASHTINFFDDFGLLIGLNGVILLAYVVAIPANEIVIPTILMLTVSHFGIIGYGAGDGVMFELDSSMETADILKAGGWTLLTGINLMLFSLLHNPCSTTIYTIYRETKSWKWTWVATLMPIVFGFIVTFLVAQFWRIIEGL
jgi:ferrous iron transport protein B